MSITRVISDVGITVARQEVVAAEFDHIYGSAHEVKAILVGPTHLLKGGNDGYARGIKVVFEARKNDGTMEERDLELTFFSDDKKTLSIKHATPREVIYGRKDVRLRERDAEDGS